MFIALIESETANMAIEDESFSKALKIANSFIDNPDYGRISAIQIFETDKIIMGSENIKEQCKLVASLRTFR